MCSPNPKVRRSILKFVSSTFKVTPHNERYRKITNMFGRKCCSRLLMVAHDLSYFLIAILLLYYAIFAENVPFEVLGPYFLGPLCYMLTIAHDCSGFMCARSLLALASKSALCRPQARSRIAILVELSKPGLRRGAKNVMIYDGTTALQVPTSAVFQCSGHLWP